MRWLVLVAFGCILANRAHAEVSANNAPKAVALQNGWSTQPLGPDVPPLRWTRAKEKVPLRSRLVTHAVGGPTLRLASHGRPLATVVIPAQANLPTRQAALVLIAVFQKMSGAAMPLVAEDSLRGEKTASKSLIAVGDTRLSRQAGIVADSLPAEGYVLKTRGKILFIVGNDAGRDRQANGTLHAAYGLLERHFGCCWLWPGELGEVLPKKADLSLAALDEAEEPALIQRTLRNYYGYTTLIDQHEQGLKRLGRSPQSFRSQSAGAVHWFAAQRLGQSVSLDYGHAFGDWWTKYGTTHPQYFALQADGTRNQEKFGKNFDDRARLDVSNPQLIEAVAADVMRQFKENPRLRCVSIAPNDGGPQSFCMDEACRRLDPPRAPKVTLSFVGRDGKRFEIQYPSLSDRYTHFYGSVAEIVGKHYPDRLLGGIAYSAYFTPPLVEKLPANVLIGFVGFDYFNDEALTTDRESWDLWTRAAHHMVVRSNLLIGGHGFPAVYVHKLAADVRHCCATGMMAGDFDSVMHNWAGSGLNYYVLAKLLWDPSQDVNAIIEDYCDAGFGTASKQIQRYFAALEWLTSDVAKRTGPGHEQDLVSSNDWYVMIHDLPKYYTPKRLDRLDQLLQDARHAAEGDDAVLSRIDFLAQAVRYARVEGAALSAYFEPENPGKKAHVLAALKARQATFQDIYDHHFLAQGLLWPLFRETDMWRKFGWNPGAEK